MGAQARATAERSPVPEARPRRASARPAGEENARREKRSPLKGMLSKVSPRLVILVILLAFFIAFAAGPTLRNLEATARLKKKEAELKAEKGATGALVVKVEEARSLEYVEREARKQRMVSPGETLYLVTSTDSSSKVHYRVKRLQSVDEAWERVRIMLNCGYSRSQGGP